MSNQQKQRTRQRTARERQSLPKGNTRLNIAFVVISSVVIVSLLVAGLVTSLSLDLLGDDGGADNDTLTDPNQDVIQDAETAVAGDPENFEQLLLLGNLLGNSNRVDEAIPVYEKAISLRPDDASARFSFARVLDDGGMDADAEVQYRRAIDLDPSYQAAHYYLAEMYRLAQPSRADEAIPLYQRAIELDTGSFIAEQSRSQLAALGVVVGGSPEAATPPA